MDIEKIRSPSDKRNRDNVCNLKLARKWYLGSSPLSPCQPSVCFIIRDLDECNSYPNQLWTTTWKPLAKAINNSGFQTKQQSQSSVRNENINFNRVQRGGGYVRVCQLWTSFLSLPLPPPSIRCWLDNVYRQVFGGSFVPASVFIWTPMSWNWIINPQAVDCNNRNRANRSDTWSIPNKGLNSTQRYFKCYRTQESMASGLLFPTKFESNSCFSSYHHLT